MGGDVNVGRAVPGSRPRRTHEAVAARGPLEHADNRIVAETLLLRRRWLGTLASHTALIRRRVPIRPACRLPFPPPEELAAEIGMVLRPPAIEGGLVSQQLGRGRHAGVELIDVMEGDRLERHG